MPYLDPRELNDLIALAGRGGIGKGVALTDCVAEAPDQLMYIKDDELILLRDLGPVILASCEGIVGWVERENVLFTSLAGSSSPQRETQGLPRTILTAPSPSPPSRSIPLRQPQSPDMNTFSQVPLQIDSHPQNKRVSGPFELESPRVTPGADTENHRFFQHQQQQRPEADEQNRDSILSTTSSEAFGGIGGFMMGGPGSEVGEEISPDILEELKDEHSPATPTIITPLHGQSSTTSQSPVTSPFPSFAPPSSLADRSFDDDTEDDNPEDEDDDDDSLDWDIYGDYARDSMYDPVKRMSMAVQLRRMSRAAKAASKLGLSRTPEDGEGDEDAVKATIAALEGKGSVGGFQLPSARRGTTSVEPMSRTNGQEREDEDDLDQPTPKIPQPSSITTASEIPSSSTSDETHEKGPSVATQLRLRILAELEREDSNEVISPVTASSDRDHDHEDRYERGLIQNGTQSSPADSSRSDKQSVEGQLTSEESGLILTPQPPEIVTFTAPSPTKTREHHSVNMMKMNSGSSLLASPLPHDEPETFDESMALPMLAVPPPPSHSPSLSPNLMSATWSPGSPSSPSSVAATRQAVEAVRSTPESNRPRGLTLVGRMEADLSAAKGPMPITFLVGGPEIPGVTPSVPPLPTAAREPVGLGLPTNGRSSPAPEPSKRSPSPFTSSPLASPKVSQESAASNLSSPFPPHPVRSVTSPVPPAPQSQMQIQTSSQSYPSQPRMRPRSRSFGSSMAKSLGVGRKDSAPALTIDTNTPPLPAMGASLPHSASSKRSFFGSRKSSLAPETPPPTSPHSLPQSVPSVIGKLSTDFSPGLPPSSARSSSFSFTSTKGSKTPRKASSATRVLPSPVSHKDFAEDTIKADGMDFELIQPRKASGLLSPSQFSVDNPSSPTSKSTASPNDYRPELDRKSTMQSQNSTSSLRPPLPETDEWGFLKDQSPTPEIFLSRSAPGDHRAMEQKWLSIISTPLAANTSPPKKVRKLVIDAGVPSSLRGKVWAWFMAGALTARVPGLYQELLAHDTGMEDERIDRDVASAYPDHSIFSDVGSAGQTDLRSILRAYSNFAPAGYRSEMSKLAGALLIHCVAEDAFWLLSGLVNSVLKDYYGKDRVGLRIDSAVFVGLLQGSEPRLAKLFRDVGIHPIAFLDRWLSQLFIRCLPWPTALRVIDAVVSEGPRFLLIASLAILTISKDRLFSLTSISQSQSQSRSQSQKNENGGNQKDKDKILRYLRDLPQDSLLLPETFMKACDNIKFRQEDWKRLRDKVEKEIMG